MWQTSNSCACADGCVRSHLFYSLMHQSSILCHARQLRAIHLIHRLLLENFKVGVGVGGHWVQLSVYVTEHTTPPSLCGLRVNDMGSCSSTRMRESREFTYRDG